MSDLAAFTQYSVNGLYLSSYYALLALGITLIFGVMEIGDVGQGGLFTLGAFLTYTASNQWMLNYFLTPFIIIPAGAILSVGFGLFIYRRLRQFGIGPTFLGAVSILLIIQSTTAMFYGERAKTIPPPLGVENIHLGAVSIYTHKLLVICATLMLLILIWYFLTKTRWGKALRALAQNKEAAALVGVNIFFITGLAFGIAGGLAGFAGWLTAPVLPFTPFAGRLTVMKAFAISRMGMGSIPGVVGTSLLVGMSESMTSAYLSPQFSNLIPFGLLAILMIYRPEVLGPEEERKARERRITGGLKIAIPYSKLVWAGLIIVALLLPFFLSENNYILHLLILVGILVIPVVGLDLLDGYTGLPSLAQGAFLGVGAYTSANLMMHLPVSSPVSFLLTILITASLGALVGMLGVRSGKRWGTFTFIVTLIFPIVVLGLDWLTGGPQGLVGIPFLSLGLPGIGKATLNPFLNKTGYYFLIISILVAILWLKTRIVRSRFGRSLMAIREDEGLAKAVGIPTKRYKVSVFTISASLAGLAGALYAHYFTYLHPDLFNFITSFKLLLMNRIGGLGSFLGPIIGPLAVIFVDDVTHPINAYLGEVIFATFLILVLLYLPGGLVSGGKKLLVHLLPDRFVKPPARGTGRSKKSSNPNGGLTQETGL